MNEHVISELMAYLDGALAPHATLRVKAHVDGCEPCRTELARLTSLRTDLDVTMKTRLSRARLSDAASTRIRERLRAEQNKPSFGQMWWNLVALFEPLVKRRYALAQATLAVLVLIFSVAAWNATTFTARADWRGPNVLNGRTVATGTPNDA